MCFCGTLRTGCLTTELVKSSTTSQQHETQRLRVISQPGDELEPWKRRMKILVFSKHLRPQSKERKDNHQKKIDTSPSAICAIVIIVLSAHQVIKNELFLETFPRWLVTTTTNPAFVRSAPSCAWSSPTHSYKPHTFSKYPLKEDDALPCLPFLKLFQGSSESSHTSLLRPPNWLYLFIKCAYRMT